MTPYLPGESPVHRCPPGAKILALVAVGTALFALPRLDLALAALAATGLLYGLAGITARLALAQLRPLAWILVVLVLVQLALDGWLSAMLVAARLAALVLLAGLVTLTTRSADLIEALQNGLAWLKPLGVNPAKVGLAIALTLRFIPVLAAITAEVREAQRARGLERSLVALTVPVVVRMLKMSDDIAAAIDARSYDPDQAGG
ncbi:energy-coupling factor transporter transmembrane component T family protein [Methylobacterium nonmethylotrophicum]|uniref:Energy-coupling factor transporter transmembrane protein EcfT n=1 Tax=Methylobacterium nonmethylotrophicum TaxID=1141884 RepID=A0A4Z0NDS9_9HYPH|nr:energy-coupling factor transporter transmembrane protein EcfT [Methylobacterium nonmethylotrophicum]TGD93879.1 energy-coupling factor transporter transmembrane protein EcfT [Methylobacterium nonmethylotrophicum]